MTIGSRAVAEFVGAVLLGIAAFSMGRVVAPSSASGEEPLTGPSERGRIVSADRPSADRPSVPAPRSTDCDAVAADLAVAQETITDLESQLYGTPVPWTDDVPEQYRPEQFEARIANVFRSCDVEAKLVGYDCDEAPCFAILDSTGVGDASSRVVDCPAWKQDWGTTIGTTSRTVKCPDGERQLLMMTPGTRLVTEDDLLAQLGHAMSDAEREASDNSMKRMQARAEAAEKQLCRPSQSN